MREPIVISTRKNTIKGYLGLGLLCTILVAFGLLIIFLANAEGFFPGYVASIFFAAGILLVVLLSIVYILLLVVLVVYLLKARKASNFVVSIDEEGVHAGKLLVAWDNIAAIYPVKFGRGEYVGVLPRNLDRALSRLPALTQGSLRWSYRQRKRRRPDMPPFILRPDNMTTQELLQRLWNDYAPEYQRYEVATHLPVPTLVPPPDKGRLKQFFVILAFSTVGMAIVLGLAMWVFPGNTNALFAMIALLFTGVLGVNFFLRRDTD